jgi:uncharacterized protein (DUF433 family)
VPKQPTSFRIPTELKDALDERARDAGVPTAALFERFLLEGLRQDSHPLIAFRDGSGGRRAVLSGTRLPVGQVIDTIETSSARGDTAVREAAEYLGLPEGHVRACVRYYAEYKSEVDGWRAHIAEIAEREREIWEREQAVLA